MASCDLAKLKTKSIHERHQLWLNAKAKSETCEDAKTLLQLIESSGLDYARDKMKPVSLDDTVGRRMKQIIGSEVGIKAMMDATRRGSPALADVDPLLQAELGPQYSRHNEATIQAGYLVKGFMVGQGFEETGPAPMPRSGCQRPLVNLGPAKLFRGAEGERLDDFVDAPKADEQSKFKKVVWSDFLEGFYLRRPIGLGSFAPVVV